MLADHQREQCHCWAQKSALAAGLQGNTGCSLKISVKQCTCSLCSRYRERERGCWRWCLLVIGTMSIRCYDLHKFDLVTIQRQQQVDSNARQ